MTTSLRKKLLSKQGLWSADEIQRRVALAREEYNRARQRMEQARKVFNLVMDEVKARCPHRQTSLQYDQFAYAGRYCTLCGELTEDLGEIVG
jgi:hypothetical protein